MLTITTGDLFAAPVQTLVNPVNTVGVMGKGLAAQFKRRCPAMLPDYRAMCEAGDFTIGELWMYTGCEPWVLNFPTKAHWRDPSQVGYIEAGLVTFVERYEAMGITSIAFPALGCGLGGLDFATQVQPLMERYLGDLPLEIWLFRPI